MTMFTLREICARTVAREKAGETEYVRISFDALLALACQAEVGFLLISSEHFESTVEFGKAEKEWLGI